MSDDYRRERRPVVYPAGEGSRPWRMRAVARRLLRGACGALADANEWEEFVADAVELAGAMAPAERETLGCADARDVIAADLARRLFGAASGTVRSAAHDAIRDAVSVLLADAVGAGAGR